MKLQNASLQIVAIRGMVSDMRKPRKDAENGSQSAKMQDIADRLGLSVATVSRALRRVPGINAETRARVMQAAGETGYRLPQSYRNTALEDDSLRHIGVFIESNQTQNPAYLTGMSDACLSLNASLAIHYVKPNECHKILDPKFAPRAMTAGLLSGIVLVYWWPTDVVRALSQKLPTVSIMHKYPGTDLDLVGVDNEGGIGQLLHELFAAGHRKIGFLGRCGRLHWANARLGGYVAALTELGLEYDPSLVVDVDFDALASPQGDWTPYLAKAEALTRKKNVTAWMCAAEPGGMQLHDYLVARGLQVPKDVSITGFHRHPEVLEGTVDLTSVGVSCEAIGAAALKRLLFRIQNPVETCRTILFPCELHPGKTIAPPPGRSR